MQSTTPRPPSSAYFLAQPVKNDPLPPELKFRENTGTSQDVPLHIGPKIYRFLYFISYSWIFIYATYH